MINFTHREEKRKYDFHIIGPLIDGLEGVKFVGRESV